MYFIHNAHHYEFVPRLCWTQIAKEQIGDSIVFDCCLKAGVFQSNRNG